MSDDEFNPDLASAGSESPAISRKKRVAPAGSSNDVASSEGGDSPPRDVELEASLHVQAEDESAAREKLFSTAHPSLDHAVAALNSFLRARGYPNVHLSKKRSANAFFKCGCGKSGCFSVSFSLAHRSTGRSWMLKAMVGLPLCPPQTAMALALQNRFIPTELKDELLMLYQSNVNVANAHSVITQRALELKVPTTWLQADVKNFFDSLNRSFNDDLIRLLDDLALAGHSVAVDFTTDATGARVLNRYLITTRQMKDAFKQWPSMVVLDATYGKNFSLMPVQCFVGTSSENVLLLFSVGSTQSEVTDDYLWLVRRFWEHHGAMARTWMTDGDEKISSSIKAVANEHGVEVQVLLCVWHLLNNIMRHLAAKKIVFDDIELKRLFYHCRAATTSDAFEQGWQLLLNKYATTEAMASYLTATVYPTRERWCLAWVNSAFHATLMASSPSESFHALLASGKSAHVSHVALVKRVDGIATKQLMEHHLRCNAWDERRAAFELKDLPGLALLVLPQIISSRAYELVLEQALLGFQMRVEKADPTDVVHIGAWNVVPLLGSPTASHLVQQVDPQAYKPGPNSRRVAACIGSALQKSSTRV